MTKTVCRVWILIFATPLQFTHSHSSSFRTSVVKITILRINKGQTKNFLTFLQPKENWDKKLCVFIQSPPVKEYWRNSLLNPTKKQQRTTKKNRKANRSQLAKAEIKKKEEHFKKLTNENPTKYQIFPVQLLDYRKIFLKRPK